METQVIWVAAVLPWNSPDAQARNRFASYDSQDLIDMCLSCQRSRCCNCHEYGERRTTAGRPHKEVNLEELRELLNLHRRSPEICAALNISERTLSRYRRALKEQKEAV